MDEVTNHPCPSSRARTRRRAATGQRGSVLLLVLAVVLMLAVGVLALLNATTSTRKVADKLETDTKTLHRIDGALERGVNQVRDDDDPATCRANMSLPDIPGFNVSCILIPSTTPTSRTMDFEVENSENQLVGAARVKVTDEVNSQPLVGYSIEVCDWLLGSRAVQDTLRGCAA